MPERKAAVATTVLVLLGNTFLSAAQVQGETQFENYCSDTGTTTLLLVDVTTPYDEQDRALFREFSVKVFEKSFDAPGKFIIRTIEDNFTKSRRLLDTCVPYCPPMEWYERMLSTCTPGGLREDQKNLAHEVRKAMTTILDQSTELPSSAIIRTLVTVVPSETVPGHKTSLFVLSDMIENSEVMGAGKFFSTPNSKLLSEFATAKLIPDLKGAAVRAVGIGRAGSEDRRPLSNYELQKLQDFWKGYFTAAGASSVILSPSIPQDL